MALIDKFIDKEKAIYKGASWRDKTKMLMHKVIDFYASFFNPRYMTDFTTTIYPHTDFGANVVGNDLLMTKIEFHENVHKWDMRGGRYLSYMVKYMYPQIFVPFILLITLALSGTLGFISFLAFMVAAHLGLFICNKSRDKEGSPTKTALVIFAVLTGTGLLSMVAGTVVGAGSWILLLWALVLLTITPIPLGSFHRAAYEMRGYTASLYQEYLRHGNVRQEIVDYYVLMFTGPSYAYMDRDRIAVRDEFNYQIKRFTETEEDFLKTWVWGDGRSNSSDADAEPFRMIKKFFEEENLANTDG